MKKIILAAITALMMTGNVNANENTSTWEMIKSKSGAFVLQKKQEFNETNWTAVKKEAVEKTKNTVTKAYNAGVAAGKAAKESWNKKSEFGYTEALNEVWEMEGVPVESLSKDDIVEIVNYYELQLKKTNDEKYKQALKNRLEILK